MPRRFTARKPLRDQVAGYAKILRNLIPEGKPMPAPVASLAYLDKPKRAYTKRVHTVKSGLSELQEQIRVIQWWDANCGWLKLPPYALFAIPNGGGRQLFDAANLKRSGTRKGVEDLFLAVAKQDRHGLFIEMKIVGEFQSDEQVTLQEFHLGQGYTSIVCFNHTQAIEAIQDYLIPF